MQENALIWKSSVKKAFYGFLGFTVGGIIGTIVDIFDNASSISNMAQSGELDFGGPNWVSILFNVVVILGFIYYLIGIKGMRDSAPKEDFPAVKQLFLGALFCVIGAGVDFIPLLGWAAAILEILGFIFMMIGFNKMKKSATLPQHAVAGSSKLFLAMLLAIIGIGVGFIPVAGDIIESILNVIVLIFGILGWKAISNSQLQ